MEGFTASQPNTKLSDLSDQWVWAPAVVLVAATKGAVTHEHPLRPMKQIRGLTKQKPGEIGWSVTFLSSTKLSYYSDYVHDQIQFSEKQIKEASTQTSNQQRTFLIAAKNSWLFTLL